MTDKDRVLKALQYGVVSPLFFSQTPTLDGGKPILRVAARVKELRIEGYEISTERASNGTARYRLVSSPVVTTAEEPPSGAFPTDGDIAEAQRAARAHDRSLSPAGRGDSGRPLASGLFDTTEFIERGDMFDLPA